MYTVFFLWLGTASFLRDALITIQLEYIEYSDMIWATWLQQMLQMITSLWAAVLVLAHNTQEVESMLSPRFENISQACICKYRCMYEYACVYIKRKKEGDRGRETETDCAQILYRLSMVAK